MFKAADINKASVIGELALLFDEYEKALVANDVPVLQEFFWPSPLALRYGATEELHGSDEIDTFRKNRVINFSERTTVRKDIVTFGDDLGIATLEFTVKVGSEKRQGRQSQIWVRFEDLGWRIVSAHVSHRSQIRTDTTLAKDYMTQAAALLQLPIAPEYADEVVQNLLVMAKVAAPLMATSLPEGVEPAPEFTP